MDPWAHLLLACTVLYCDFYGHEALKGLFLGKKSPTKLERFGNTRYNTRKTRDRRPQDPKIRDREDRDIEVRDPTRAGIISTATQGHGPDRCNEINLHISIHTHIHNIASIFA
ncbi:uncharacterized protein PV07_11341 [Cladophialophora immunda]|uniref:Uncharacterized protein n=1 Tax=Cladophialophora immunda TaxID=569365 RepID=A0A0D2BXS1_9EURO|nr:uncharacterized protein PV07_11341 [Cladophialophora immunda]KIW23115.1 hypothetical protein PV07_11341 [Cladophialophora immunda]